MSDGTRLWPERRRAIRYSAQDSSLLLTVVQNDRHRPATLHDISSEGIGVLLDRAIDPGAFIRVEIHSRAKHCWYLKKARVVHAQPQAVGAWLAGISFLMKFDEVDVPALFAEYALVPECALPFAWCRQPASDLALPAAAERPLWPVAASGQ